MLENREYRAFADSITEKLLKKYPLVVRRSKGKIPYTAAAGVFDDRSGDELVGWWTNGFWGGLLWQLFGASGDSLYKEEAIRQEELLDSVLMKWALDHDNGFRWLPTSMAHYRHNQNPGSLNRLMLAANNFCGRFNLSGRFFRAWNDFGDLDRRGLAIIDCMMNLPLLYWASDYTRDPRFKQMAAAHADTTMRDFIRENGSAEHILRYDIETGALLESLGGQGYASGSSWTRGQSWALYGFLFSYLHTGDRRYLDTSCRVADYVLSRIPESGLIPIDYDQPSDVTLEDSTAAAITASGLISLHEQTKKEVYLDTALRLLRVLDEKRCNYDADVDPLLEKCSAAYHDKVHEFPIIYGDYYYVEAILKLAGKATWIW